MVSGVKLGQLATCQMCKVAWNMPGGLRGKRIYRETPDYVVLDDIDLHPENEYAILFIFKDHVRNPSARRVALAKRVLLEVGEELNGDRARVLVTMKHYPLHWHMHLFIKKREGNGSI